LKADHRLREYYRRRVLGGAALVVSESCAIDHPSATKNPTFARISPDTRAAWRACVAGVHEAGGAMFLQLWHQGAVNYGGDAESNPAFVALSPSGIAHPGESFGRAATEAELAGLKRAFVQGALDAAEIGADGVELHSAHGFLLDQFLWPGTNLRSDRYGGPAVTDRATFVAEVAETVREAAGWVKSFTGAPVIAVGSVGLDVDVMATLTGQEARPTGASRIGELVRRFQRGDFDLVSVGRSQIGDPEWVAKMTRHRIPDIRAFRVDDTSLSHDV
jgi:2,4-dienoyl-CoA reductase-like NADH-dependent reductase (Old Yellow Enzyme family)